MLGCLGGGGLILEKKDFLSYLNSEPIETHNQRVKQLEITVAPWLLKKLLYWRVFVNTGDLILKPST